MYVLPMPVSSAGVPYSRIVPDAFLPSIDFLTAIAAEVLAVPKTLCPQPWPAPASGRSFRSGVVSCDSPGSASNSAKIPMTGFPLPYDATNAVGIPATPFSTVKPLASRKSVNSFADLNSCSPVSAYVQIFLLTRLMASAFASIHPVAIFFASCASKALVVRKQKAATIVLILITPPSLKARLP